MSKVTIKDVAREAGVSPALVSLVLNGKGNVSKESAKRVMEVVKQMGFRPNRAAASLRTGVKRVIGVITPSISNHYFSDISRHIENIAYDKGYTVLFGSSDESPRKMGDLIDTFISEGVGGLMITPCTGCEQEIRRALDVNVPVVLMNRDLPELEGVGRVFLNNDKAVRMCVDHLLDMGYRHISMISNAIKLSTLNLREQHYLEYMDELGLRDRAHIYYIKESDGPQVITDTVRRAHEQGSDALLVPRGYLTVDAMMAMRAAGLSVPDDMALMGFDGGMLYDMTTPRISQVFQSTEDTALEAFNMLSSMMNGDQASTVLIEPGLKPAESTAVKSLISKGNEILVPASIFAVRGGWTLDQQFYDQCGSSVLIAHGLGKAVADAVTGIDVQTGGRYHVWVRTRNWTAKWSDAPTPGIFRVKVDDTMLPAYFGTGDSQWHWEDGGVVTLDKGTHQLALCDTCGFDARVCSIYLALEDDAPVLAPSEDIRALRSRILGLPGLPVDKGDFDLLVAGGGIAGICAAVSAARCGLKVALVHDRFVLGGNNSSEVRVGLGGRLNIGRFPSLGYLLNELGPSTKGNARPAEVYEDDKKLRIVLAENNIRLFLGYRVTAAQKENDSIVSVTATDVQTYSEIRLHASLFSDCTGDSVLGALAGADMAMGREAHSTYNEPSAPEVADGMTLGASMQWYCEESDAPETFPDIDWGLKIDENTVQKVRRGQWYWEVGMADDQIEDAEMIRDYGMYVAYSNWSYLKNHASFKDEYSHSELKWLSSVIGKRESRRMIGDMVLTENDLLNFVQYPDGCVCTSWYIDNHEPDPDNAAAFDMPWLSRGVLRSLDFYPLPYRCFYSRNVDNLFMAGRNISVSHLALGTTRVMRTCAMIGEVVGMAASVCTRHGCTPRDVVPACWDELKTLMSKGVGRTDVPYLQVYTLVDTTGERSEDC